MLKILKEELAKQGVFDHPEHPFVNALVDAIPFSTVPEKMKIVFALSHLSAYATQFRRSLLLPDGTPVPVNNISFVIADSGANKDSSNNKIKSCFKKGYEAITEYNKEQAKKLAIQAARDAGEDLPELPAIYRSYLKPVPPAFTSFTTGPGLVQFINDIAEMPATSAVMYSGELSDELNQNPHALENIKTISEVYDIGDKEITYLKSSEHRSKEIKGQAVSALMVGSPGHILYDESTKKKFHVAFMSKLARRSWFCYAPERLKEPDFTQEENPIKALQEYEESVEAAANKAVRRVREGVELLTAHNMERLSQALPMSVEVFDMFNLYKRYNREVVDNLSNRESVYALVRAHLQWKALKLAGALAVVNMDDTIELKHYIPAIQYAEMFDQDISHFEKDINKAPHECLADFLKTIMVDEEKAFINTHDIKKYGFSQTVSQNKLQELVTLCAGYDLDGVYSLADGATGIYYEPVRKTDVLGISYKPMDFTRLYEAIAENVSQDRISSIKQDYGKHTSHGYTFGETTFEDLAAMLTTDCVYTPFQFENNERSKDGIVGGTKWLVMDVDKTTLSYEDAHFILSGYNHHVALTSDKDNHYKYRVLLELDSVVTLNAMEWKRFYTSIAEDIGLDVDVLPQSQIFFSYRGREVLSCVDGTPLATRDYIMRAKERATVPLSAQKISKNQQNAMLDNQLDTFWYAFEAKPGRRSSYYYRAIRHAKDLGADYEYVQDLLANINEYVVTPLSTDRFEKLLEQAERLYRES